MLVHRHHQLRRNEKNMVSTTTREPTFTFSIRVPQSLHELLQERAKELKVPQNRLVLEGLEARLNGDRTDATPHDIGRKAP